MYDNIVSLKFIKGQNNETMVSALVSAEGEEMALSTNVLTEGRIEEWMYAVLTEMRIANRKITKHALFYYCANKKTRVEWMMLYQVQLSLAQFFIQSHVVTDVLSGRHLYMQ